MSIALSQCSSIFSIKIPYPFGTLYQTDIVDIRKGSAGNPGEMTGMIVYSSDHVLGEITNNSIRGIFGVCNSKALAHPGHCP